MSIYYSLVRKTSQPGKKGAHQKVYAVAQYSSVLKSEELMKLVAKHFSVADRATVMSVISSLVDCLREQLLDGKRVEFGDLGTFYCVINSEGVENAKDFHAKRNIKGITVNWRPSKYFRKLGEHAKYRRVPPRVITDAIRKKSGKDAVQKAIAQHRMKVDARREANAKKKEQQ